MFEDIDPHGMPKKHSIPEGSLMEYAEDASSDSHDQAPAAPISDAELVALRDEEHDRYLAYLANEKDETSQDNKRKTRKRSEAQRGKHSARRKDGLYHTGDRLEVGDFLPGFGPVTYSNHREASAYAAKLNRGLKASRPITEIFNRE